MGKTIKVKEITPGVLLQEGVRFNADVAKKYFGPLVGKTIKNVLLQEDSISGGSDPEIILEFETGDAAAILCDPEGNGPGFIEYIKK